jgi:hypothetical protein
MFINITKLFPLPETPLSRIHGAGWAEFDRTFANGVLSSPKNSKEGRFEDDERRSRNADGGLRTPAVLCLQ